MKSLATLAIYAALAIGGAANAQATPPTAPTTAAPQRPNISAASYTALGNLYYSQGQYDSAYVAYRAATESDPKSTDALLGLGRSQTKLRLFAPAIDTLRQLTELDPRNLSAHMALAQAYVAQYVGSSDRTAVQNNLDEALKVLGTAEVVQPGSAVVWNERSLVYKLKGDYDRAIEMSQRAASIDPNDSIILYNLGDLYRASGNLPLALDALQKAVIANPTDAHARSYYGRLLLQTGNLDHARMELAQAERLEPNNAYAVGQYGVYGYLAKDPTLARIKLTQALKLDPLRYPEFYYYLGRLDLDSGAVAQARAGFTKAAALASTNPEYFYWLGRAQEASGDKGAARAAYSRALSLSPGLKEAQDGLGRVK